MTEHDDLTETERSHLMRHLLSGRDTFAGKQPRLADWFHRRLVELEDQRADERRLIESASPEPGTAVIVGKTNPVDDPELFDRPLFDVPDPDAFGAPDE